MNNKIINRHTGLDIIRCIALVCVLSSHSLLYNDFYSEIVDGNTMLILVIMRSCCLICVPLFIMLTGYLSQSKTITGKYYFKLNRVLFIYVMASLFCGFYEKWILHTGTTIPRILLRILAFRSAPYSWYIEMYIGLFLIIPFLNILYDGLITKRNKKILVLTFLILTTLPSIMNIYCISGLDWWLKPSTRNDYFPIVPAWWQGVYPITYYYLGKYMREFPQNKPYFKTIISIFIVFLFAGLFNYYRSYGSTFISGPWQNNGSFLLTCQSVLVFSLFANINYSKMCTALKRLFAVVSDLSLGAYLTSWIFDRWLYWELTEAVPDMAQQLYYLPVVILIVLIGSLFLSAIINILYSVFSKTVLQRIETKYLSH